MGLPRHEQAQIRAVAKARRNAGRRRTSPAYAVAWELPEYRRCTGCGWWLSEGQVAAYGGWAVTGRLRWCEPCHLAAELRRESRRLADGARRAA